jgi:carbon starvation protein CstA
MKPKTIYLVLCFAGAVLPYWQFVPWVTQNGLSVPLMVRELFAYRISAFFVMDVLVSAVVLIVFMRVEGARLNIRRRWLPLLAVLTVGVSLGLPMFLYMRELRMEQLKSMEGNPVPA